MPWASSRTGTLTSTSHQPVGLYGFITATPVATPIQCSQQHCQPGCTTVAHMFNTLHRGHWKCGCNNNAAQKPSERGSQSQCIPRPSAQTQALAGPTQCCHKPCRTAQWPGQLAGCELTARRTAGCHGQGLALRPSKLIISHHLTIRAVHGMHGR